MSLEPDVPVDPPLRRPPPLPAKRKRVHPAVWIVLAVSLLLNLGLMASRSWSGIRGGHGETPPVEATLAWGDDGADRRVALLGLEGVILREATPSLFGEQLDPVSRLLNEIQAVTADPAYDAILLEVDSPGGGVTASDEIYHALMEFKASRPGRRIVVHVKDMAASGGYYAALAGDVIVAQPTSMVGSIGVLISAVNLHKLGQKLGIDDVTLTSSDNKALLNSLDPVDPEHKAILQRVVDDMYVRFRELVLTHRPFDEEFAETHQLLDGRVFTTPAALELGLVDETGYGEEARAAVLRLLDVEEAGFYEVSYAGGGIGWFSARAPTLRIPMVPRSRLMYLWKP